MYIRNLEELKLKPTGCTFTITHEGIAEGLKKKFPVVGHSEDGSPIFMWSRELCAEMERLHYTQSA